MYCPCPVTQLGPVPRESIAAAPVDIAHAQYHYQFIVFASFVTKLSQSSVEQEIQVHLALISVVNYIIVLHTRQSPPLEPLYQVTNTKRTIANIAECD